MGIQCACPIAPRALHRGKRLQICNETGCFASFTSETNSGWAVESGEVLRVVDRSYVDYLGSQHLKTYGKTFSVLAVGPYYAFKAAIGI